MAWRRCAVGVAHGVLRGLVVHRIRLGGGRRSQLVTAASAGHRSLGGGGYEAKNFRACWLVRVSVECAQHGGRRGALADHTLAVKGGTIWRSVSPRIWRHDKGDRRGGNDEQTSGH